MTLTAPSGTALRSIELDWDGRLVSGDWRLGLVRGDGRLLAGCQPSRSRPRSRCRLGDPKGAMRVTRGLGGAGSVSLEALCARRAGCSTAASRRSGDRTRARLATHRATVVVADGSAPNVSGGGALVNGGWQRGVVDASVRASDNVGIRSTSLRVNGATRDARPERCDFSRPVPCAEAVQGAFRLDTRELSDGRHDLALGALDAAGNAGSAESTIRVDNTAPASVRDLRLLGGEGVRSTNSFDLAWTPPAAQAAPIVRAHYRLCREDAPGECVTGARTGATAGIDNLSVPSRGDWRFQVWLEDEAGNVTPASASGPVTLRFDDRAPSTLSVGLDDGDGSPAGRTTVNFGTRAVIRGSLASTAGERIEQAPLAVHTRTDGAERFRRVGATATDAAGRFSYRLPAGPSRTVRVTFSGDDRHRPTGADADLAVRADSSIAVSRHRVRNGDSVRFDGQLRGGHVPSNGKLLQLEAFYRDRWRTFAVVRSSPRGRWRYDYRFEATRGRVRYPFRVRVPRERDYPYALGRSRVVRVTVNDR